VVALRQTGQLSSRGYVVDRQSSGKPADRLAEAYTTEYI
jgi:hypothetical protein